MPKRTHTPGPWKVVNGVDVQSYPLGCLAYVSTAGARGRTLDEAEANARLIAAAPALLAAAEAVLADLDARIDAAVVAKAPVPVYSGIAALHSAIDRARGQ